MSIQYCRSRTKALMTNRIDLRIPEKLMPLATEKRRFKIVIGGRGSAKSQTFATLLASTVGMIGARVLAAREHMNSISDSVHSLIADQINNYQMPGFDVLANEIKNINGGGIFYRGLARNPEGLKSVNDVSRAWVEEAQTISDASLQMLTPSIRAPGSEIWMSANPRSRKDAFSQRFIAPFEKELARDGYYSDDMHLIIKLNYYDNPWFPAELEQERQYDYDHKVRAKYNHIWLGDYDDTVDDAIIMTEWFDACVDAHVKLGFKPEGVEVVAHDPSDEGGDAKGLSYRHGSVLLDVQERDIGDINAGADWAIDYALSKKPDHFMWDGDGMGAGLKRQVTQAFSGKKVDVEMYSGAGAVLRPSELYEEEPSRIETAINAKTNKETFRNRRAQSYWLLRDRMYRTFQAVENNVKTVAPENLISLDSGIKNIEALRAELCRIPLKYNSNGLIQMMTKSEMLKLGISSPNMADSVKMAYNPRLASVTKIPADWVNKRRANTTRTGY